MTFLKELFGVFEKRDKRNFFILVAFLIASGFTAVLGVGAVIPFMTALIDPKKLESIAFFKGMDYQSIVLVCVIGLIGAFWLKNIIAYIAIWAQSKIVFGISARVSKRLFRKYMTAPYSWHLSKNTPDLMRNVNSETGIFANNVVNAFGTMLTEIASATIVVCLLLYINFWFTVVVCVILAMTLFIFARWTRKNAHHYGNLRREVASQQVRQVLHGLGGIKETKIYHTESRFLDRYYAAVDDSARVNIFLAVNQSSSRYFIEVIAITVILILVYFFISAGESSQSIMLLLSVFGVAAVQLLPSMNRLMQAYATIRFSRPALYTMYAELMDQSPNDVLGRGILAINFEREIKLEAVSFCYNKDKVVLSKVNLEIKKGQSVAFVGHSGAGKTTLIDLILGLYNPMAGSIEVDGVALNSDNLKSWQKNFGYIPQQIMLYEGTVKDNVMASTVNQGISDAKIWKALEIASLDAFVRKLPKQLDQPIGENGVRLSGGQRQRIGIARAMLNDPDILVMDEATAALDNQTEREVTWAINNASEGRTVITIAHRLSTIENYDVIYVMDKGRIVSAGTYGSLFETCEVFRKMAAVNNHEPILEGCERGRRL